MADEYARLKRCREVAYEVIGRMLRDEPIGETDVANVARFAHAYLSMLRREGFLTPEDEIALDSDPDPSLFARRSAGTA